MKRSLLTDVIYVQHVSITKLQESGWDVSDDGKQVDYVDGTLQNEFILGCLTNRQRKIANYLDEGYSRKEIARQLSISVQAIHQIVLRMRRRLVQKADIKDYQNYE